MRSAGVPTVGKSTPLGLEVYLYLQLPISNALPKSEISFYTMHGPLCPHFALYLK